MSLTDPHVRRGEGLVLPLSLVWTIGGGLIALGMYVGSTVAATNASVSSVAAQITGMRASIESDIGDLKAELRDMKIQSDVNRGAVHDIELRLQRLEDRAAQVKK